MIVSVCEVRPCWKSDTGKWFLDFPTNEWDNYEDDFLHVNIPINYCPYTGKELKEDTDCGYNQRQL